MCQPVGIAGVLHRELGRHGVVRAPVTPCNRLWWTRLAIPQRIPSRMSVAFRGNVPRNCGEAFLRKRRSDGLTGGRPAVLWVVFAFVVVLICVESSERIAVS
jgi:hypothetical protein